MENIIIAGFDIATLRKQQVAIRQDASKFISDKIAEAKELAQAIAESDDAGEIEKLAGEALSKLQAVETVAQVSGVEYYLHNRGDSCYDSSDDVITSILEEAYEEHGSVCGELGELIALAEEMEYQTDRWNTSYC